MDKSLYNLGDVSKLLGVKPHTITYALASGGVPEPSLRLGNRRMFTSDDVRRLAEYLRVALGTGSQPGEAARGCIDERREGDDHPADDAGTPPLIPPFCVVQAGPKCHEIRDGHDDVIAWAADQAKALMVAGLLEHTCR